MSNKVKLKNLSSYIGSGITPRRDNKSYWENGTVPWLKTEQLDQHQIYDTTEKISQIALEETSIKLYPVNTLSIAMYGEGQTRGNVAILKKEMTTNQACCNIVIDRAKADYEYVYYYLKTQYQQLRRLSSGIRKNLNSNDIKEFEITLPEDIETQHKIASVLSALDAKIELNNCINAELEVMAKTLYDYWFVQFDFPDKEGEPYKSSGGKMMWSDELKREIPEGWKVESIEECCQIIDCLHSKKPDYCYEDEKYYLIQLDNLLANGLIDVSAKYYVSPSDYAEWTSRIEVKENDILITNAGRVASTTQVPKEIVSGIGRNITAIRPLTIQPTYLFLTFKGHDMIRQIQWNTDVGSFFSSFNVKGIKKLYVLRPLEKIEVEFESKVFPLRRKRELQLTENQTLSSLRDWLLLMLMNGQVKVE